MVKRLCQLSITVLSQLLLLAFHQLQLVTCEKFSVKNHLSTGTRYGDSVLFPSAELPTAPPGCYPVHINLVARHGTRGPTFSRIRQINQLARKIRSEAIRLHIDSHSTHESSRSEERNPAIHEGEVVNVKKNKVTTSLSWMAGFRSPWENKTVGGEIVEEGEKEHYELGKRMRERFPSLFSHRYHSSVYPIYATQVPRASASAVAFGMGLFEGKGKLGPGAHSAFSVVTETKKTDRHLRFHTSCEAYVQSKTSETGPMTDALLENIHNSIAPNLRERLSLNLTGYETGSLWLLCRQQAAVFGDLEKACKVFTPEEILLLEWADDVAMFWVKGYGYDLNYRMGVPLLSDIANSMDESIRVSLEESKGKRTEFAERARLRFAHAETVIPFVCLLGLFKGNDTNYVNIRKQVGRSSMLKDPSMLFSLPSPPTPRAWKGSQVSPYAGNTALVLYKCSAEQIEREDEKRNTEFSKFRVLVLHNEQPVLLPACDNDLFCPYKVFKERVISSQLVHTFDTMCSVPDKLQKSNRSIYGIIVDYITMLFSSWKSIESEL